MSDGMILSGTTFSEPSLRWRSLPDLKTVETTVDALKPRGIHAELVPDGQTALSRLVQLIPSGAEVMTGGSRTLDEIGFTDLLKSGNHPWKNLKAAILAETDPAKQIELRARATTSEYFLGSVHGITHSGEIVVASAGGSQISAYASGARNVIWVVGTHKIVSTLEDALERVREYALPLEDQRMKSMGFPGSYIGKILIFEKEARRNINLIFVNQQLGF
jgi:hypothetical protein